MNLLNSHLKLCSIKSYNSIFKRSLSTAISQKCISIEQLKKRCLLRICGPETTDYLQGLVTNDLQVFKLASTNGIEPQCTYALLLNFHGRVLYDTLLYKISENEYLIEHDVAAVDYMKRHLEMYRLRKQVKVESVKELSVWVAYPYEENFNSFTNHLKDEFISHFKNTKYVVTAARDPRMSNLGFRIITENNNKAEQLLMNLGTKPTENTYDLLRYKLGIGEGVKDHPPGSCLPFETNVDFLNGISFQKGCYIGQELTARVHHTGVIRKRIMPIVLQLGSERYPDLPVGGTVVNEKEKKVGRFRSNIGYYGLAVLNIEECLKAQKLLLTGININISTARPNWWPQDANKM